MNDPTPLDASIWKRALSETSAGGDPLLDAALESDPAVRDALIEAEATDRILREHLRSEPSLEDRILAHMEADFARQSPNAKAPPGKGPSGSSPVRFLVWLSLAAAACLALVFSAPWQRPGALRWAESQILATTFKGEGPSARNWSEAEMDNQAKALQASIQSAYDAGTPAKDAWHLAVFAQQNADGALVLTVQAQAQGAPRPNDEWTLVIPSLDSAAAAREGISRTIADRLRQGASPAPTP